MNGSRQTSTPATLQAATGLLVLVILWCCLSYSGIVMPFFLASPTDVLSVLGHLIFTRAFWSDIITSVFRIGAGFLLSLIVAIPLGALLVMSPVANRVLIPPISFIRYLPVPALIPFLILWFGVGESEKIAVVFVGVFFQLVLIIVDDLCTVPEELRDIARSLGATEWKIFASVTFPHAVPALYDAARITLAWAWGWVMLAEVVGSSSGIGYMIVKAQRFLLNAEMIVGLLSIGLLGLMADALMSYARPHLFRWT
jgi:NitT/TauT family transport system permease protein